MVFSRLYASARLKNLINDSTPLGKHFKLWNSRMLIVAALPIIATISMLLYGRYVLVRETDQAMKEVHHKETLDELFESLKTDGVFLKPLDIDVDCSERDRMARLKQTMTDLQKIKRFLAIERKYIDPDMVESKLERVNVLSAEDRKRLKDSKAYYQDKTAMNKF